MTNDLQALLYDSLMNNSYDFESMHDQLKSSWMHAFSYLYALQRSRAEYSELFYYSNDTIGHDQTKIGPLFLDKLIRACFDVEYDMVKTCARKEYYSSDFYNKEINFSDIVENPAIFLKCPIVIIDDFVIWDYKLRLNGDTTEIILPFGRSFVLKDERSETDDVIYKDHDIQFLIVENTFYERIEVDPNALNYNPIDRSVRILKDLITGDVPDFNTGKMFVTLHFPSIYPKDFKLGTTLLEVSEEDEYYVIYVDERTGFDIENAQIKVYASFVFIRNLYSHDMFDSGNNEITVNGDGSTTLMVIEGNLDPIPVENFMVFKRDNDFAPYSLKPHLDMLKMYYPNIYEISDENKLPGNRYKIYYFYMDIPEMTYHVMFDFYYRYLTDLFPGISMEQIINIIYQYNPSMGYPLFDDLTDEQTELFIERFKEIMNYQYYNYQYGETDFINRWQIIPGNENKSGLEYQDETLKEWIKDDPEILHKYVLSQKKLGTTYTLFTNTLNLNERIRYNTDTEFPGSSREFSEPRYVFALENSRNDGQILNARIFVDGICITDTYQRRKRFMDYFYIPVSDITDDSIIDIEVFPYYSFAKDHTFNSTSDALEINLNDPEVPIWATISDLYVYDTTNTEGEVTLDSPRIDHGLFDVIEHYSRGDMLIENHPSAEHKSYYTRLKNFSIQPKDDRMVDKTLRIVFNKLPHWYPFRYEGTESKRLYIEFNSSELNWNFAVKYLRVFVNGRLLPKTHYIFQPNYAKPRIFFLDIFNLGDIIYFDITPYQYKEVYYQRILDENQTLIDLSGYITKPFDIRYYDVYLNGRKLDIGNVFAITPWKITLTNIKSIYNLQIFERERDWEHFGLDYSQMRYPYTIDDLINEEFVSDDEKAKIIKDKIESLKDHRLNIVPNTNEEVEIIYDTDQMRSLAEAYFFYYDELIPKTYVNPDVLQFKEEYIQDTYDKVYEAYHTKPEVKPDDDLYSSALMINPDMYFEGMNPDIEEFPNWVYMMGHPDAVSDEILAEEITIDNTPYYESLVKEVKIRLYPDGKIAVSDPTFVDIISLENEKNIVIRESGVYRLHGTGDNVKIILEDSTTADITLILDSVNINNTSITTTGPVIYVNDTITTLNVLLAGNSVIITRNIAESNAGVIIKAMNPDTLKIYVTKVYKSSSLKLINGSSIEDIEDLDNEGSGIYVVGTIIFND